MNITMPASHHLVLALTTFARATMLTILMVAGVSWCRVYPADTIR